MDISKRKRGAENGGMGSDSAASIDFRSVFSSAGHLARTEEGNVALLLMIPFLSVVLALLSFPKSSRSSVWSVM